MYFGTGFVVPFAGCGSFSWQKGAKEGEQEEQEEKQEQEEEQEGTLGW